MTAVLNAQKLMNSFVPITRFNKGEAGKIFNEVHKDGIKIVMKNNMPECVLLSPEAYSKMLEDMEDEVLLAIAEERLSKSNGKGVPMEQVMKEAGITQADLDAIPDEEIEIE